nr:unnamed protein product [Digitaria exilis]
MLRGLREASKLVLGDRQKLAVPRKLVAFATSPASCLRQPPRNRTPSLGASSKRERTTTLRPGGGGASRGWDLGGEGSRRGGAGVRQARGATVPAPRARRDGRAQAVREREEGDGEGWGVAQAGAADKPSLYLAMSPDRSGPGPMIQSPPTHQLPPELSSVREAAAVGVRTTGELRRPRAQSNTPWTRFRSTRPRAQPGADQAGVLGGGGARDRDSDTRDPYDAVQPEAIRSIAYVRAGAGGRRWEAYARSAPSIRLDGLRPSHVTSSIGWLELDSARAINDGRFAVRGRVLVIATPPRRGLVDVTHA